MLSVIVAAGSPDDTEDCLQAAKDFTTEFSGVEFLTIAQGSDATASEQHWTQAFHRANGEFVLALTSDIRVVPNTVRALLSTLEQSPDKDLVGPAIAVGPATVPSALFDSDAGVCLLVRRKSVLRGASNLGYVPFAYATSGSVS